MIASLLTWRAVTGTIDIASVRTPRSEIFYWVTIMFSQTLGTALGDWFADTADLGYLGAATVFGAGLLVLALLYYFTSASRTILFWIAFILTRPLGAVVGDSPGEIDLNWNAVSGAKSYEIHTATDPNTPSSWAFKDNSTKSKATLNGLTSASRIWVRVRAIGTNDKGGWSDPAETVVP